MYPTLRLWVMRVASGIIKLVLSIIINKFKTFTIALNFAAHFQNLLPSGVISSRHRSEQLI